MRYVSKSFKKFRRIDSVNQLSFALGPQKRLIPIQLHTPNTVGRATIAAIDSTRIPGANQQRGTFNQPKEVENEEFG